MSQQRYILQQLANDPLILPGLAPGYDHVDLTGFFMKPKNVMLGDLDGAAIFAHLDDKPGEYEGHYLLHPGRMYNRTICRSFIDTMFTEHAARAIWGHTPTENAAARALSRHLGFAPRGSSLLPSGRPCVTYVLERREWARLSGESSAA